MNGILLISFVWKENLKIPTWVLIILAGAIIWFCKVLNFYILNGRSASDKDGYFTCITYNGASIVDYCLVSLEMFDRSQDFVVLNENFSPSVHNPISFSITSNNAVINNNNKWLVLLVYKELKIIGIVWINSFITNLGSEDLTNKFNMILCESSSQIVNTGHT